MRRHLTLFGLLQTLTGMALLLLPAFGVQAQTSNAPALMNFQGRLTKLDGM